METVLTVAAGARLHFEHGWPIELLAMQPHKDYAFDLASFMPPNLADEYIAAEIKPTVREFAALSSNLRRCCLDDHDDDCVTKKPRRNAHRKWSALRARKPPLLWLVGPSPHSEVYRLLHRPDGVIEMEPVDNSALDFA